MLKESTVLNNVRDTVASLPDGGGRHGNHKTWILRKDSHGPYKAFQSTWIPLCEERGKIWVFTKGTWCCRNVQNVQWMVC